ncbi:MAG: HAD family hydrolase [Patescibacteria group bacterium]|nr:HAD family hydrolase [Patescibacteria group bacterium]
MSTKLKLVVGSSERASAKEPLMAGLAVPPDPLPRQVRGLLFDFGGVLYDDTVWRRWLLRLLAHAGLHTHYNSFYCVWDRDFAADVYCGRRTFCDAFSAFLRAAGVPRGLVDEILAACRGLRRDLDESIRPLPGVRCTLARLARMNFLLGILSDSELPAEQLSAYLAEFAPLQVFDAVVSSIDLGRMKPDSECYLAALAKMGLAPSEVAFVGHKAAELAGARAVGMATVAVNGGLDAEADIYLDRFDQLADIVTLHRPLAAAG